ncbi:MFS transporter [Paenibacillus sp.]|uniref:MFS transporter n=1 Tax=Paenibacillus sp. TaxID=58172 RepID=UPI00283A8C84|nr:MFS transporter [Paenibacillus sp.]
MKGLLANRPFLIVMLSSLVHNSGIWIRNMALLFFVMEKTQGDPIAVSLLTIVEYFPIFLFSVVGGILADRWRPKRTMIWGDVLSFASIVAILIVVASGLWQAVFVTTAVSAIASQFSQPSSMKIIKHHVPEEHIQIAMGLNQTIMSLFIIVGPVIGTSIYQLFGVEYSLLSLLVLFTLSAVILSFLPSSQFTREVEKTSILQDIKSGFQYVKLHRHLKTLMLMFSVLAFGIGLIQPLDVFIITDRLGIAKENLQWFTALAGVGTLFGAIISAAVFKRINGRLTIFTGLAFLGAATIVEVLSIWPILTGSMRFTTGIFMAFVQTILSTLMITTVEERYIGRINGLITPLFTGFLLIGTSISGVYLANTSLITVFITAGVIFVLAACVSLKFSFSSSTKSNTISTIDN